MLNNIILKNISKLQGSRQMPVSPTLNGSLGGRDAKGVIPRIFEGRQYFIHSLNTRKKVIVTILFTFIRNFFFFNRNILSTVVYDNGQLYLYLHTITNYKLLIMEKRAKKLFCSPPNKQ